MTPLERPPPPCDACLSLRLPKKIAWLGLAAFMVVAGVTHFTSTPLYVAFMPSWIPMHLALVYISGVVEAALGLLLLWRRTTRIAAFGIIATLVAIFPANINHALVGGISHPDLPEMFANPTVAWARLPVQALFIAWAWWMTRPPLPGDAAKPHGQPATSS